MRWAPSTLPYQDPTGRKPQMEVGGPQPGPRFIEENDVQPPMNVKMGPQIGGAPVGPPGPGGPPGTFDTLDGIPAGGGRYGGPPYGGGYGGGYGGPRGGWGGGWGGPRGGWNPRGGFGGGYGGPMRGGGGYFQPGGGYQGQTGGHMYAPPPFGVVGDGPEGTIAENYKPTQFSQSLEELVRQRDLAQKQQPQMMTNEMGLPQGTYGGGQPIAGQMARAPRFGDPGYGQPSGPPRGGWGGGWGGPRGGGYGGGRYGGPTYQQPQTFGMPSYATVEPQQTKPLAQPPVYSTGQGLPNSNGIKPATPSPLYPTGGWKPPKPTPATETKPQAPPYMAPPTTVTANTDRNNTNRQQKAMLAPQQPGMPYSKPETM